LQVVMTEKSLKNIISDYSQMNVDSLIELKNLVEDCPYSQSAQILYLLNLKRLAEDTFDVRLPHTAIHVNDRQKLKQLVEQIETILAEEKGTNPHVGARHASPSSVPYPPLAGGRGVGFGANYKSSPSPAPTVMEPATPSTQHPATSNLTTFRSKTISELLNLKKTKPEPIATPKPPKALQCRDDKLLEQLRLEALAKVNDRLNEIRKTMSVGANSTETPSRMAANQEIIDKVIATNPRISKVDDSDIRQSKLSHWKHKEEHSLREDFELVSETLAQLYITQGAPAKAREIYKTLSKIHPEKTNYFTQLSKQIKTNQKNKKS